MTIIIHADRRPDRAGRPIPAGQSREGSMRRPTDRVSVAKDARDLIRKQLRAGDDAAKVERLIRARLPKAWELLDRNALIALTVVPPADGCHWCPAFDRAKKEEGIDAPRNTEDTRVLLGAPCRTRCVPRLNAAWARAKAEAEAVQADAARESRGVTWCASHARWEATRPALTAAGRRPIPVAPTGMLWAGPEPHEARALVAAATRPARPHRRRIAISRYQLVDRSRLVDPAAYQLLGQPAG
jgi:hypothetical protein